MRLAQHHGHRGEKLIPGLEQARFAVYEWRQQEIAHFPARAAPPSPPDQHQHMEHKLLVAQEAANGSRAG
jgi:hypothetical protein